MPFSMQSTSELANSATAPKYKRIVLKLSGEALGNRETGETIDPDLLETVCREVKAVHELGVQVGLVVGGGNIFRGLQGATNRGVDRTTGDYMGMMATVINGLALMDCLEKLDVDVRVMSAIEMDRVAEPYILRRATRHLEKHRVVIFAGGHRESLFLHRHDRGPPRPTRSTPKSFSKQPRSTAFTTKTR